MTFGSKAMNPRERRAYALATRTKANANPTKENLRRAIEQDDQMAKGPRKSRALGQSAIRQVFSLPDHVIVFDWGVYLDPDEPNFKLLDTAGSLQNIAGELLGGYIVPAELSARWQAELHNDAPLGDKRHGAYNEILEGNYPAVMTGIAHADRIKDPRLVIGGLIPLAEALNIGALIDDEWETHGILSPVVSSPHTIVGGAVKLAEQQRKTKPL